MSRPKTNMFKFKQGDRVVFGTYHGEWKVDIYVPLLRTWIGGIFLERPNQSLVVRSCDDRLAILVVDWYEFTPLEYIPFGSAFRTHVDSLEESKIK